MPMRGAADRPARSRIVQGGASFAELAKVHSADIFRREGRRSRLDLSRRYRARIPSRRWMPKPGEVSQPVQSPFGWHLIVVEERRVQDVRRPQARRRPQRAARTQVRRGLPGLAASAGATAPTSNTGSKTAEGRSSAGRVGRLRRPAAQRLNHPISPLPIPRSSPSPAANPPAGLTCAPRCRAASGRRVWSSSATGR